MLRAAHLYDGKADAMVSPGVVVISEGRIVAAGPNAQVPAGARVLDLGDATLLPGLMDAHTHLSFESSLDWKQDQLDSLKKPITEQAIIATEYARRTLMAGFTTVRDVGSSYLIDVGLLNAISRERKLDVRCVEPAVATEVRHVRSEQHAIRGRAGADSERIEQAHERAEQHQPPKGRRRRAHPFSSLSSSTSIGSRRR